MPQHTTKILIIEDNPLDVRMVKEYLNEDRNFKYELTSADTLAKGFKELSSNEFDVLLLDLNLPDSVGLETFEKTCTRFNQLPIILLTGVDDEELATGAIKKGAQDYLVKSQINDTLLIKSIRYSIERKHLGMELKLAKEKAEESDRLKSAFLANMSHEIRTPMNGLLGFAELLKEPMLSGEEQKSYIGMIEKSGARLLNIINDLINISKIESGQMKLSITSVELEELIEYIHHFFKIETNEKGLDFRLVRDTEASNLIFKTDKEKIYAILTNLVKNAIKYTLKGKIEFGYTMIDNQLKFFVKDTGIGIPKNKLDNIFNRFEQVENKMPGCVEGAGLGLSITKAYVELLKGKIWVESTEGVGSSFYFTIPFKAQTQTVAGKNLGLLSQVDQPSSRKLKVLVAEDDEMSQKYTRAILKNLSSDIIIRSNGIETVEICRNNPEIDLVLMDIQMPVMDGYEATRMIREFNKTVVIIAQTAFAISGDRKKALDAGCNDYISKPINRKLLLQLIDKQFSRLNIRN